MSYSAKQKKVQTTVEGASTLVKDLKAMEDAAASVMMDGAKAGGNIALADAKRNCPVDTGALKQSLKLSELSKTTTKATVQVDYDKSLTYGVHVELGSRGRKANPFLRNAVDNNQTQINEAIVSEISKAVGRHL
jgi:HK97 gp10 family phage protein